MPAVGRFAGSIKTGKFIEMFVTKKKKHRNNFWLHTISFQFFFQTRDHESVYFGEDMKDSF